MKFLMGSIVTLLVSFSLMAQNRRLISEDSAILIDGVELGYIITEEDTRSAGNEEFARFKISFYANNGGCPRAYRLRDPNNSSTATGYAENLVARFFVRNANGKRMTSREALVRADEWWVPVRLKEKDSNGKDVTRVRELMAGYIFRVGDHLEESIIALVPKGERPIVDVVLGRSSDL